MNPPRRRGGRVALSIDMDAPQDYQGFYGQPTEGNADAFLDRVIAELLELLHEHGLKATFFAIARDLSGPLARRRYREVVESGHEVANHSLSHPVAFRTLSSATKMREIGEAHRILEDVIRTKIVGFRCPAYDVDEATLQILLDLGYRYDSSLNPTPFLVPMKWIVRWKSKRWKVGLGTLRQSMGRRNPHFLWSGNRGIHRGNRPPSENASMVELPLTVGPPWRFPFYGTITQIRGLSWFETSLRKLDSEGEVINYSIHAAELLDPDTMGVVPGYGSPLKQRRDILQESLGLLAQGNQSLTLGQWAESLDSRESDKNVA